MSLKPWLLSVPLLGILDPLHWSCYGAPQNHIQWGVVRPPANIVLGPSQPLGSQPLLHVMARLKPDSSKNMNGFHQLPALSPSKKKFIVGKTNTDNNDIDFWGFFFSQQQPSWNWSYLNILNPQLLHFYNLNI